MPARNEDQRLDGAQLSSRTFSRQGMKDFLKSDGVKFSSVSSGLSPRAFFKNRCKGTLADWVITIVRDNPSKEAADLALKS